jgi:hypothetical protein
LQLSGGIAKSTISTGGTAGPVEITDPSLLGDPRSVTPTVGNNSTKIATTAWVWGQNFVQAGVGYNIVGGFLFTPFAGGTISTGTYALVPSAGNYQYYSNGGAHSVSAPTLGDCAIDVLITNIAGAGAITFTGFTVGSNVGDALTTTNGHRFMLSVRRINAISTYTIKALQ